MKLKVKQSLYKVTIKLCFVKFCNFLESVLLEDLSEGFDQSETDEDDVKIDDDSSNEGIFILGSQTLSNGEVLGIEDQVESEDDDAQSQQDQSEEGNVSGNEEGQIREKSTSEDVDGTSEESEIQTGGEGIEQEGDDQEEDGGDKESKDSARVREPGKGVCEQEGEENVCDDINVASSEPVSLEIDDDGNKKENDSQGDTDPLLVLDPFVSNLGVGLFFTSSNLFETEESQSDKGNEVLDSKKGIELSEEDNSRGGSFVKEFGRVRKVINDMVAHLMKEFDKLFEYYLDKVVKEQNKWIFESKLIRITDSRFFLKSNDPFRFYFFPFFESYGEIDEIEFHLSSLCIFLLPLMLF